MIGIGQVDFEALTALLIRLGVVVGATSLFQWLMNLCNNHMTYKVVMDVRTEAFEKVFGNINLDVSYKSFSVTDIDLILSNILVDGNGKWSLIDYEWTFHFPIPVQFLIYRVIHYYEQSNAFRNRVLSSWNLYQEEGISEREKMLFREMEENFQKYMLEEYVPLRHLYPSISPGRIHLETMLENIKFKERLQIFLSCNGIFTESESVSFPIEQGEIEIKLEIPEGVTAIRIDPGEEMGRLEIQQMEWEGGIECGFIIRKGNFISGKRPPGICRKYSGKKQNIIFEGTKAL